MSHDIVSNMIKEMQLSPQKLQEISSQDPANSGQMPMTGQMQAQGQMPMHGSPEQQLQAMQLLQQQEQLKQQQLQYQQQMQQMQMQQAQQQQQQQQQHVDESTESTGSVADMAQFGMPGKEDGSIVDQVLAQLQNPLIVVVAFIIMSLPQVTTGLTGLLRAYVSPKGYLMLAIRAVLSAGLFYLANFFLE